MMWKREYLYYKYPDLPTKDNHQIEQLLRETDFDSPEAKAFRAGWEHCIYRAGVAVEAAISSITK